MNGSSPQLDAPRRERIEAALDVALSALRRIARPGAAALAQRAVARIEAILPEKGRAMIAAPIPGRDRRRIAGMPAAEYHALRALSASGAWLLSEECAAKFLWKSPWNPLYEPETKSEFDIGIAAHLAVLEPERQAGSIVLIEAGDYRTARAREARDAARAEGKVPLLPWQHDIVRAIAGSLRAHPVAAQAFRDGDAEATLLWHDPETGAPCKARPDYLPVQGHWLVDLKTAASANPRAWRDQAYRLGYHARAAWYLDGAATVLGQAPEEYWFVIVEKEPPYLVSVIRFDEEALSWGRIANRKACQSFARAAALNDWPGYRAPGHHQDRAFRVGLPSCGRSASCRTAKRPASSATRPSPNRSRRRRPSAFWPARSEARSWASSISPRPSAPARIC